ncbi:MAG: 1,4-beta-xylanase [Porticoccaceae bacterium]|nr:1,4-beta-xylanase [Porticoccaceae bacterium]|tara:strand:+ start:20045 stop:21229 length:1185 start_codon:yes stop_codon:yes gene_type:complete
MNVNRRQFVVNSALALAVFTSLKNHAINKNMLDTGLAEIFKDDFLIGTAISNKTLVENDASMLSLISKEFNAITTENALKWSEVHPEPNIWNFGPVDKFVEFGRNHKMSMIGHTLTWHRQTPANLFSETIKQVEHCSSCHSYQRVTSRNELIKRLQAHVSVLMDRYKRDIHTWDVANEVVESDGEWRESDWYKILGHEFLDLSFRFAREAHPEACLLYNDFHLEKPKKCSSIIHKLKTLQNRGIKVDGVGIQCHIKLNSESPAIRELETAILALHDSGFRVHITELDIDVLPEAWIHRGRHIDTFPNKSELNPYTSGIPRQISQELSARYRAVFDLFIKHRDKIDRVALWGTTDDESWKNGLPIAGRTSYPLLFDRNKLPKPAYYAVREAKRTK